MPEIERESISRHRRALKVGLLLPTNTDIIDGSAQTWGSLIGIAKRAEEVGFDSLWVPDDFLLRFPAGKPIGFWECWSILAALAASTTRIELGSLISSTGFRNPALLARIADTVDEISGGRLILGLGAGGDEGEHRAYGFPWEERYSRFEEALTIIHSLFHEGYADFNGRHYQVRDAELLPRGPRKNGPPLLIGSYDTIGPRMLRLIAQYGDYWNCWLAYGQSMPEMVPPLRLALDQACQKIGRPPESLGRTVVVGVVLLGNRLILEGMQDFTGGSLSGSPEEIAAGLRAFAQEGIAHVQIFLSPATMAGIEAFAPVLELLDRE